MSGFDINTVTLSGGLTRDPELRSLPSGTEVCTLRLAYTERFKDGSTGEWQSRSNYIDVTVWKGLGAAIAKQLAKGDKVVVGGRLRWREWSTDSGEKRQATDIIADSVVPVPRSDGGGGRQSRSDLDESFAPRDDGFEPRREPAPVASGARDDNDDIPF